MTAPAFTQPGQSLQRLRRVYRVFRDQHGREFEAWCDSGNNQPVEEMRPKGFLPPWLPPQRFAKFQNAGDLDFQWDYVTMANELSGDTAAFYQDAVKFAIENNKPEPDVGGPVDRSIRYVFGRPPLSPAVPLAAAQGDAWVLGQPGAPVNAYLKEVLEQGVGANSKETLEYIRVMVERNKAANPVAQIEQPARAPLVEKVKSIADPAPVEEMPLPNYQDFVRECRGRKMSMPDIYEMWEKHKQLVKDAATAPAVEVGV